MALAIYDTAVMNRVVDSLIRPKAALLTQHFTEVQQSEDEKIYFDVQVSARRLAPFVHSSLAGRFVEGLGFKTNDFEPAYIKDKRVLDPHRALKRQIGETIGGSSSPGARNQAVLTQELVDQQDMATRRYETMASEVLRTGKVTITGDGYDTVVVDFLRAASQTVVLTGANRWGQTGIVPLENIEDWSDTMLINEGVVVTTVTMDVAAWRLFTADQTTKDQLDIRRIQQTDVNVRAMAKQGLKFKGTIDEVNYYVYSDHYVDSGGTTQPMMPANSVILTGDTLEGVRHFGAILDEGAGFQARESFTKSWVEEDPSVRLLLMQTAPILVPRRPNASFGVTVN